ncbi:MAG: site-specific DNA-methyltransferase [Kordiimonadaceae bacterium]|nr:site-specific DNA-methyltransferase [Kordiimonadaceae bacterium]
MIGTVYKPIQGITLVCGDVRNFDAVDIQAPAVITDPPYKLTQGGKRKGHFSGGKMANYDNNGRPVTCDITWTEVMRVVDTLAAKQSDIFVMASAANENVFKAHAAAKAQGLRYHNNFQWDKGTPTRNRWGMRHLEDILYLYKGKAVKLRNCGQKQLIDIPRCKESQHPTPKPVDLMRLLITLVTSPGDLVVDPFMGGGSCAVAAVLEGRDFMGFELEPEHFDEACERVQAAIIDMAFKQRVAV